MASSSELIAQNSTFILKDEQDLEKGGVGSKSMTVTLNWLQLTQHFVP